MKKKSFLIVGLVMALLLSLVGACAKPAPPAPPPAPAPAPAPAPTPAPKFFVLKMQNGYPPLHRLTPDAFHWWGKEIEKRTNGRVRMVWFDGATLASGPDAYEAIRDGVADGGNIDLHREDPLFMPQQFTAVPYHFENSWQTSPTWWEVLQWSPDLQRNFANAGIVPVWVHTTDIFNFHSTKKIYKVPEDSKGELLYSPGKLYEEIITGIGATPITTPYEDTYTAVERGMMTGLTWPWAPIRSAKLTDLLKYHTVLNISVITWGGYMNQRVWNSFPPDIQKVFMDLALSMSALSGATLTNEASDVIREMKEKGHTFFEPKGAEREAFVRLTGKAIEESWIKQVTKMGYPAKEILAKGDEIAKKYAGNAYGFDDWWGIAGRVWMLKK